MLLIAAGCGLCRHIFKARQRTADMKKWSLVSPRANRAPPRFRQPAGDLLFGDAIVHQIAQLVCCSAMPSRSEAASRAWWAREWYQDEALNVKRGPDILRQICCRQIVFAHRRSEGSSICSDKSIPRAGHGDLEAVSPTSGWVTPLSLWYGQY